MFSGGEDIEYFRPFSPWHTGIVLSQPQGIERRDCAWQNDDYKKTYFLTSAGDYAYYVSARDLRYFIPIAD